MMTKIPSFGKKEPTCTYQNNRYDSFMPYFFFGLRATEPYFRFYFLSLENLLRGKQIIH